MKTYTITHTGFHGTHTLRIRPLKIVGEYGAVSEATRDRLNNEVCGINGCRCGETVAAYDWDYRAVPEYPAWVYLGSAE